MTKSSFDNYDAFNDHQNKLMKFLESIYNKSESVSSYMIGEK